MGCFWALVNYVSDRHADVLFTMSASFLSGQGELSVAAGFVFETL